MNRFNEKGFTLIEALVVVGILAVVAFLAQPYFNDWKRNAQFKEGARLLASAFREARSVAISRNREARVVVDVSGKAFSLEVGNLPSNSSAWTDLKGEIRFSPAVSLKTSAACNGTSNLSIEFNPNGTGQTEKVCIMDGSTEKYIVGVLSSTSGRVGIEKK